MFPVLYEKDVTTIENNGFGFLTDCIECKISETLNGEYSLKMTYPLDGLHAEEIIEGRLLYAQRDNTGDKQLFRISEITADYIARNIEVYAPHISRDLDGYGFPISTGTKRTWASWFTNVFNNPDALFNSPLPFTLTYDSALANKYAKQQSREDSWLTFFNTNIPDAGESQAEMYYDNFDVHVLAARGTETNFEVRYGKNLTALKSQTATAAKYYGVLPIYANEKRFVSTNSINHAGDWTRADPTKRLWCTVNFQSEVEELVDVETADNYDIQQALYTASNAWNVANQAERAKFNGVTIDFEYLDLANSGIYWSGPKPNEMYIDIGDYITVFYGEVNEKTEINEIVYDSLKERFEKLTAGQLRPNLAKTIKQIAQGV